VEKSEQIRQTMRETSEKRKGQVCRVFELKIIENKLNRATKEIFDRIFLEAKWLYNHWLAQENIFDLSDKITEVKVKVGDKYETRELVFLSSQMKQSILDQLKQNIFNLAKKKKSGSNIGRLKFKSFYRSINLKQFDNTYKISGNYIRIQGIKQWLRVNGMEQTEGYEFSNAKFISKPSGYYLNVTCYREKQKPIKQKAKPDIGIDFGVKTQLTLSNGIEVNYAIEATKRMRRYCAQASNKTLSSRKRWKANERLRKEYEHLNNIKKDITNKVVHILHNEANIISYQNDNIRGWQRIWGRRMFNTRLGGIKAGLKQIPTSVEVETFFPSTKQCPECQHKQNVSLDERIFVCECCGFTRHRDWKSAEMIRDEGLLKIGVERTKLTPVESLASTQRILRRLNAVSNVRASLLVEAGSPLL